MEEARHFAMREWTISFEGMCVCVYVYLVALIDRNPDSAVFSFGAPRKQWDTLRLIPVQNNEPKHGATGSIDLFGHSLRDRCFIFARWWNVYACRTADWAKFPQETVEPCASHNFCLSPKLSRWTAHCILCVCETRKTFIQAYTRGDDPMSKFSKRECIR